MSDYPYLSLSRVTIDPEVARLLPRQLAYYYLALPLARDDDQLTLVMAHPDNPAAMAVLRAVLGETVVPVQGAAKEIRATLNQVWAGPADAETQHILSCCTVPAWIDLVTEAADRMAQAFGAAITSLSASQNTLETVLTVAREGQYSLTVIDMPPGEALSALLRSSSSPVLLVRGAAFNLRHILLVLRGHSPDESVLDWVIPLANTYHTLVTLLTVAPAAVTGRRVQRGPRMPHGLAALLTAESGPGEHIATCARRLNEAGVHGLVKLRQGELEEQIAAEVAGGSYDLITLAAEAHGDVVQRILRQLDTLPPDHRQPVLVIKPLTE
ncbi:MAG: universal stress protein [Chloroflexi bacterium]|nr:universal stress protein [Chloroflexota bacterium]